MVCRCTSNEMHQARAEEDRLASQRSNIEYYKKQAAKLELEIQAMSTKPDNFEIIDAANVGPHLVLKVKYPSCKNCFYEGEKVLVYLNKQTSDALFWKKIDPHFRGPSDKNNKKEAPSPDARFPASTEGWKKACMFANVSA